MIKEIYLNNLPHHGKTINWKESMGFIVQFNYDGIIGSMKIIKYQKEKHRLTIEYNDKLYEIFTGHFCDCKFGNILHHRIKKKYTKYKYQIGDIINTKNGQIKILQQIRMNHDHCKGYVYQCLKDGYIGNIDEYGLIDGVGCPVCYNHKIIKGINDMWTTAPETAKLLANPEDGYKYTRQSNKRTDFRCPVCGNIIKNKVISSIDSSGLSCPSCSDGISYPEKFMYNLLNQLNIDFVYQKKFDWCKYKFKDIIKTGRYDFYIPSKHLIIEMDGGYGHGNKNIQELTKEESKYIDNEKDSLARQHNIEPIRIDCYYEQQHNLTKCDYIKHNILNSNISKIFNITTINWISIDATSQISLVKTVCDYKNNHSNMTTSEIGKVFKLRSGTISIYLKRGNKYGWCIYDAKEESKRIGKMNGKRNGDLLSKAVICLTTQKIYKSITAAAKDIHISHASIQNCCHHKTLTSGQLLNGTKLKWMFLDEYYKILKENN